jgi:hypothetical protein
VIFVNTMIFLEIPSLSNFSIIFKSLQHVFLVPSCGTSL